MFGRIPFNQIALATVLGVGGGIYIYRPVFEPPRKPPGTHNEQDTTDRIEQRSLNVRGQENIADQTREPPSTHEAVAPK